MIRLERKEKKNQKEIDSFINQLNSTLNAVNTVRYDSDFEEPDIKDEIFDDLEIEALQAENNSNEKSDDYIVHRYSDRESPTKPSNYSRVKQSVDDYDLIDDSDNENEEEILKGAAEEERRIKIYNNYKNNSHKNNLDLNNDYDPSLLLNTTLGATNHMYNRINSLEA
jgi:hypothetical protein